MQKGAVRGRTRGGAKFRALLEEVRGCRICADELPLGPRPILQIDPRASVLVAAQAPGTRVHETGVPFRDPSGERLREWMGVSEGVFYDPSRVAILPMGFCYPGRGRSGDLPPRPECAEAWRRKLLACLPRLELTLAVGRYALDFHIPESRASSLTDTVRAWRDYIPDRIPLPHPSPRNNLWLRRNPWFEEEVLPVLRGRLRALG